MGGPLGFSGGSASGWYRAGLSRLRLGRPEASTAGDVEAVAVDVLSSAGFFLICVSVGMMFNIYIYICLDGCIDDYLRRLY